jgi:hypothetical protein
MAILRLAWKEQERVPSGFRNFLLSLELPGYLAEDLEKQGQRGRFGGPVVLLIKSIII